MKANTNAGWLRSPSAGNGVILALGILLPLSLVAAVSFGTMSLPLQDVYGVLYYKGMHALFGVPVPDQWAAGSALHDVVWLIRLPRLVLGAAVGAALAVCGVVMQAIVKNPLADPYILGISSGASLGATLAALFGVGAVLGARSWQTWAGAQRRSSCCWQAQPFLRFAGRSPISPSICETMTRHRHKSFAGLWAGWGQPTGRITS